MNKVTLSDGKEYEPSFDVENTCFRGFSIYSAAKKPSLSLLSESRMFIRMEGDARPQRVIQKPLSEIPMEDFEMTSRGAGLVMCDLDGGVVCSLALSDEGEPNTLFICTIYDTDCL